MLQISPVLTIFEITVSSFHQLAKLPVQLKFPILSYKHCNQQSHELVRTTPNDTPRPATDGVPRMVVPSSHRRPGTFHKPPATYARPGNCKVNELFGPSDRISASPRGPSLSSARTLIKNLTFSFDFSGRMKSSPAGREIDI